MPTSAVKKKHQCDFCGRSIASSKRQKKFCSRRCSLVSRNNQFSKNLIKNMTKKIVIKRNGCWVWTGCRNSKGYGCIGISGKTLLAHRVMLSIVMSCKLNVLDLVLHSCDNPPCVNPSHLRNGSPLDNARDAQQRNRLRVGEAHPKSKVSEADVIQIRNSADTPTVLAKRFGISRSSVWDILHYKTWRHV